MADKLIIIAGPTATGKTALAVDIANTIGGEVVSADSMLVYRGLNIGAAKPSPEEMRGVLHHLIDVVDPDQEYSVAVYQKQARACINSILAGGKTPLLVGGTGLYIRSVIDDYDFSKVVRDEDLRADLQREAARDGSDALHRRLAGIDPKAAERLHPKDIRRIARALEVYYLTGKPLSDSWRLENNKPLYNLLFLGLNMDRQILYRRIEDRVDSMIEAGLLEEARGLRERGYGPGLTSMQGLGYKEIQTYLTGSVSWEETVALIKRNTRRFAKRQLTWFRRDRRIKWLQAGSPAVTREAIELWRLFQKGDLPDNG